jgi:hydroxymethylglutaryl-CoA lyase
MGGMGGPTAAIVGGVPAKGVTEYVARSYRAGLVATEDFVTLCEAMGVETGIDVDKAHQIGKWMERILERKLWSFSLPHGRIPRGSEIIKGREKQMS